jgi:hypothetical protein
MTTLVDRVGQTYGRLTVIERAESLRVPSGKSLTRWTCRCECGETVTVLTDHLRSGHTVSCGCRMREAGRENGLLRKPVPGYVAAHARVWKERGKAKQQPCVDCTAPADDWSYDHTDPDEMRDEQGRAYSGKPEHYSPRCKPCHRVFDREHG